MCELPPVIIIKDKPLIVVEEAKIWQRSKPSKKEMGRGARSWTHMHTLQNKKIVRFQYHLWDQQGRGICQVAEKATPPESSIIIPYCVLGTEFCQYAIDLRLHFIIALPSSPSVLVWHDAERLSRNFWAHTDISSSQNHQSGVVQLL